MSSLASGTGPATARGVPRAEPDATSDVVVSGLADEMARVDARLRSRVDDGGAVMTGVDLHLTDVVERIRSRVSGGKRLRATFCVWGALSAAGDGGGPVPAAVVDAAAALELFHLAALVHDDVMDHSDLRRGVPTVHRSLAALHRDRGLRGDAGEFGDSAAVLAGDLCLTWSDDLMATAVAAAGRRGPAARAVWERMRTEVLAGQYLDLLAHARPSGSPADVDKVLRYKSASYTVQHPLLLGATLAGADAALLDALVPFGLLVGEAFQLRDDVLGVVGDPAVTGKPNGDDVREGKRTVVVAEADRSADPEQRAVLRRHLGDPQLTPDGLAAFRRMLVATGALGRVERRIAGCAARAHALLGQMPAPATARAALGQLTDACAWRTA